MSHENVHAYSALNDWSIIYYKKWSTMPKNYPNPTVVAKGIGMSHACIVCHFVSTTTIVREGTNPPSTHFLLWQKFFGHVQVYHKLNIIVRTEIELGVYISDLHACTSPA